MNPHLVTQLIATTDEIRELRARTADLEEAVRSLQRQVIALREACYRIAEGGQPTLAEVGR